VDFYDEGVDVKIPRFRIAWAMAFIALAALDFRAMRAMFNHEGHTTLLSLGAMPMANVLVVGLLFRHRCRRSRRFLSGFVVSGAMALAIFIAASLFAEELVNSYIILAYAEFFGAKGTLRSLQGYFGAYYFILAVWIGLPQLTFALVGGLLFHAFRNRRTARPNRC
jgi:hypothetical protein